MYVFVMYYIYGVFKSSLLIESTDSMITLSNNIERGYNQSSESTRGLHTRYYISSFRPQDIEAKFGDGWTIHSWPSFTRPWFMQSQ